MSLPPPGEADLKRFLSIIAMAAAQLTAQAQGYPNRPVRIVAPSAPASAADTVARVIAPLLSERIGQPVVVDTRPGAATILGTEAVAKSPPDGHTLLIGLPALTINPSIWFGLMTPTGTPKEVIERLNREIVAILR